MMLVQLAGSANLSHSFLRQLELVPPAEDDAADSIYVAGGIRHRKAASVRGYRVRGYRVRGYRVRGYRLFVATGKQEWR